jgi:hypothetical protein
MDRFSRDLDNYITGHYGEDQFKEDVAMPDHTPSPWIAQKFNDVKSWTISYNGLSIATVRPCRRIPPEEVKANALLMAASPNLLAACEELVSWALSDHTDPDATPADVAVRGAVYAIAKAKGE